MKVNFQNEFLDLVGELGNISFGSASTALNAIVNQDVTISAPKVEITSKEKLIKSFPDPSILIGVEYTEGLEGHNVLLLNPKDAAIISDLMMGGDGLINGDNIKLTELELSALQEAMNQMMGSASTAMSEFLGKSINILPPELVFAKLEEHELINEFFSDEILIEVNFDLEIGDIVKSKLMQAINITFAKQLASDLLGI